MISVIKRKNDVADIACGLGFVLLAWTSFILTKEMEVRSVIATIMVSICGLRLSWHIYNRNKGKSEDYHYQQWRNELGKLFDLRSYLQVYILQGLFLFIIVLPVLAINKGGGETFGALDLLGIFIWLIGFYFEVVGDWQLAKFIKNPVNKVKLMMSGLWQYTRHHNYFGEVTQWWGIWLVALSTPIGLISVVGPLTITFLIIKISGIPLLEKKIEKYPSFAQYKK